MQASGTHLIVIDCFMLQERSMDSPCDNKSEYCNGILKFSAFLGDGGRKCSSSPIVELTCRYLFKTPRQLKGLSASLLVLTIFLSSSCPIFLPSRSGWVFGTYRGPHFPNRVWLHVWQLRFQWFQLDRKCVEFSHTSPCQWTNQHHTPGFLVWPREDRSQNFCTMISTTMPSTCFHCYELNIRSYMT